jgi:hypothetical protein
MSGGYLWREWLQRFDGNADLALNTALNIADRLAHEHSEKKREELRRIKRAILCGCILGGRRLGTAGARRASPPAVTLQRFALGAQACCVAGGFSAVGEVTIAAALAGGL